MRLVFIAVVVHAVFLASVFEIYFRSPVEQGLGSHVSPLPPPARRLVLFVADGLRADALYGGGNAPFLRSVARKRGVWGVSHTRVPTESRPGHVALIAGLYEDPSAVAKGWKENPVEFDSVFNQSRETWSWGSPDILPMFSKGATGGRVWVDAYDASQEDFSGQNSTTFLDTWVFARVQEFLEKAKNDTELLKRVNADRVVFFLHLLGLDTAGHTHKPHSDEYRTNVNVVDEGVAKMEKLFEDFFFHDNQTAYVFTSDHGMTDWGSHGAGDESETETPVVAWGAGVAGPRPSPPRRANPLAPQSAAWRLADVWRRDVQQADVAPLMAALIGAPLPANSVGTLPADYLSVNEETLAEAMFANARQITALYTRKRLHAEGHSLRWLHRPFAPLAPNKEEQTLEDIRNNIKGGHFKEAVALSRTLMALCLLGKTYYEAYLQPLLLSAVSLAFLGWIALLLAHLALPHSQGPLRPLRGGPYVNGAFLLLFVTAVVLLFVQQQPVQVYLYCLLPVALWWAVARQHAQLLPALRRVKGSSCSPWRAIGTAALSVAALELLVMSFFWRGSLSLALVPVAVWPLVSHRHSLSWQLLAAWLCTNCTLAVFPALPVVGAEANNEFVQVSGLLWVLGGAVLSALGAVTKVDERRSAWLLGILSVLLAVATWNVGAVARSLENKRGLLLANQLLSWVLSGVSLLLPLVASRRMWVRLSALALAQAVPVVLLSARHESLFLLALVVHSGTWICLELALAGVPSYQVTKVHFLISDSSRKDSPGASLLTAKDFRRAYFFLLYILLSFFGTGNVASLNSFDPTWVRCFLTVFSPFTMAALILCRTAVPFFVVTCSFRAQNVLMQVPPQHLFLLVLALCDLLGVHFLHLVTNEGSWQRIGESLSHYVIVMATTLFLLLLYALARLLTGARLSCSHKCHEQCHSRATRSLESGETPKHINCLLELASSRKRHLE